MGRASVTSAVLLLSARTHGWGADYAGFFHATDWAGGVTTEQGGVKMPSGDAVPETLRADTCYEDAKCEAFGGYVSTDGTYYRTLDYTSDYDMYIAINASAIAGYASCDVVRYGCTASAKWLHCTLDLFNQVLASFNLPPDQVHSACVQNPQCVAFRVKNDGTAGDLFKNTGSNAPGWFLVSSLKGERRRSSTLPSFQNRSTEWTPRATRWHRVCARACARDAPRGGNLRGG